jgi:hypothetical protein
MARWCLARYTRQRRVRCTEPPKQSRQRFDQVKSDHILRRHAMLSAADDSCMLVSVRVSCRYLDAWSARQRRRPSSSSICSGSGNWLADVFAVSKH